MNWRRTSAGTVLVAMLAVAGNAAAPLSARVPLTGIAADGIAAAWGTAAVNHDAGVVDNHASGDMPGSTLAALDSLPCSELLNTHRGCDDAVASGLPRDNGLIDYALGDLFVNHGAPGSSRVREANGDPVSPPSTDDRPAGRLRSSGGWNAFQNFWAPAFTQWPTAPGSDPLRTAAVYSMLDDPSGGDRSGGIQLGSDPGSFPAGEGSTAWPSTLDELACTLSCLGGPAAANGSPAAVPEPATVALLGLGMLGFGLRRRARFTAP